MKQGLLGEGGEAMSFVIGDTRLGYHRGVEDLRHQPVRALDDFKAVCRELVYTTARPGCDTFCGWAPQS